MLGLMSDAETRRETAIRLRLEGNSTSQIAHALGLKSGGGALSKWLKGVPPPEWTKRPNAKEDVRARAVLMRLDGRSHREIAKVLGVSRSTVSVWLRDVILTDAQRASLMARQVDSGKRRAATIKAQRATERERIQREARGQVGDLAQSELFVAGVVAYWAEGAKAKAWRPGGQVSFTNSDPTMIRLFLAWLRLIGVERDRVTFRLHIHESADPLAAAEFWAKEVTSPMSAFRKTVLKRHNPQTSRRNTGESYRGCLIVRVRRSTDLYLQIVGWYQGLIAQLERVAVPSRPIGRTPDFGSGN